MNNKECEVLLRFSVPKEKKDILFKLQQILNDELDIHFDTGGYLDENENLVRDWEFDWSLKGPVKVYFKRFKGDK